jgi:DNA recombination protein RmuC
MDVNAMVIVAGLVVIVGLAVAVGVLMAQRREPVAPAAPNLTIDTAVITGAVRDVVRDSVDAQVRTATEAVMQSLNAQIDRTYQARTQSLTTETKSLLEPVASQMNELRTAVGNLQNSYTNAAGYTNALGERLDALATTTSALQAALKSTSARGAWGEQQLRNVIELAGMAPYCDYTEQTTVSGADSRQRPDAIVRLPNDGTVIIDAKAPLSAYLKAQETTDVALQRQFLTEHASLVKGHAKTLSDKAYWKQFSRAPEYVIMFIPGESFLADALRSDPTLLEEAMRHRVLIASPVNLLALLLAVAKGWQAYQIADNAQKIADTALELYERVGTVLKSVADTGKGLNTAISAYNSMIGSIDSRMLVSLRKLKELGIATTELEAPSTVEVTTRELKAPEIDGQ